jgi:hypothetical protein
VSKLQFSLDVYDRISDKVNIPQKDIITVNNDIKNRLSIATLQVIDDLLDMIDKCEEKK